MLVRSLKQEIKRSFTNIPNTEVELTGWWHHSGTSFPSQRRMVIAISANSSCLLRRWCVGILLVNPIFVLTKFAKLDKMTKIVETSDCAYASVDKFPVVHYVRVVRVEHE